MTRAGRNEERLASLSYRGQRRYSAIRRIAPYSALTRSRIRHHHHHFFLSYTTQRDIEEVRRPSDRYKVAGDASTRKLFVLAAFKPRFF